VGKRVAPVAVEVEPGLWLGKFEAMKSPCEVWLQVDSEDQAVELTWLAAQEAWRVEEKYSRFLSESMIGHINRSHGQWVELDPETLSLMHFADTSWRATDGLLDITIGGFMRLWRFDGKTPPPPRSRLKKAKAYVGWDKVELAGNRIRLPEGVSLDLGGIGKEYAVDRTAMLLNKLVPRGGLMVNFGGDLNAHRPRSSGRPWEIGVEAMAANRKKVIQRISLVRGAVATSGDTKRFAVDRRGKVLGHVLNPRTGWPVANGPATVTVISGLATQAGVLSTCAMLKGPKAESFLSRQGVRFYVQRR